MGRKKKSLVDYRREYPDLEVKRVKRQGKEEKETLRCVYCKTAVTPQANRIHEHLNSKTHLKLKARREETAQGAGEASTSLGLLQRMETLAETLQTHNEKAERYFRRYEEAVAELEKFKEGCRECKERAESPLLFGLSPLSPLLLKEEPAERPVGQHQDNGAAIQMARIKQDINEMIKTLQEHLQALEDSSDPRVLKCLQDVEKPISEVVYQVTQNESCT